jgi:hypothetical protein
MKAIRVEYEMSDDDYEEMLDDIYGEVSVCGYKYGSGQLLKEIDPTAFRCGKSDEESNHGDMWECSECNEQYEDETEANECCVEDTEEN